MKGKLFVLMLALIKATFTFFDMKKIKIIINNEARRFCATTRSVLEGTLSFSLFNLICKKSRIFCKWKTFFFVPHYPSFMPSFSFPF
jgi:hypothetical protein